MHPQHQNLADGRWQKLTLMEQLGNIGSEISRATNAEHKSEEEFKAATYRALELFDLTLSDPRWRGRLREIARAREVFLDTALGSKDYKSSLEELDRYFLPFAFAARLQH
jgi:hypothetical protein